ncbi:MAG: glycoside hydrolase family 127 protein [Defluviitaleaceae bacterium]|nr:glycoside hydrolase family 127 protein [Defluviitaleaceae bacterium]
MDKIKPLPLKDVEISGSFWDRYIALMREKVIPYQWEILGDRVLDAAKSHCLKNFEIAAGKSQGEFYGMVFQDSDLYKWLECVAYSLETKPDPKLEALADDAISLIGAAQRPDGYINTYYTIKEPEGRWTNLQQGHELYCAGHLIEAAVAYYSATGKRTLLDIALRFADCIDNVFGLEDGKINGYPGHQEVELALYKLFETTRDRRYLSLAAYFTNQRGKAPNYFDAEQEKIGYNEIFPHITPLDRTYSQSHLPPVKQRSAIGHAVRAVYMYSAMADLAAELNDTALLAACDALYEDITTKKMYITGAIGSAAFAERFTSPYDLPNDLIYGETCASVGLMMFCRRMNALYGDARYADVMERALYNTVLAGISLSGTEFFYVNPLETEPRKIPHNPNYEHIKPVRQKWFDCACCPSNLARTVMGLGGYAYGKTKDALYVNLYCEGSARDGSRGINIYTQYPFENTATLIISGGKFDLYLRNPETAPIQTISINNEPVSPREEKGYIVLEREWQGDTIFIRFDMQPKLIYCANEVQHNIGKAAVTRGPIVYCIEQADNGTLLGSYLLDENAPITVAKPPDGIPAEAVALESSAFKYEQAGTELYTSAKPALKPCGITLIPYFLWANRGENEMRVFIPVKPK